MSPALKEKLGLILFELALVAAFWFFFKLVWQLGAVLVAAVLLSGLAPERYSRLASGLALLGVAAFFYFWAGHKQLAAILGVFGGVLALYGAVTLATRPRAAQD
jgi:hypothetical protein